MLELKRYLVENIALCADTTTFTPQKNKFELGAKITSAFFRANDNDKNFKITLDIHIFIKDTDFDLKLKISGFFSVSDNVEEKDIEEYMKKTAPMILIHTARDTIMTITSKTIYGAITIPIFNI